MALQRSKLSRFELSSRAPRRRYTPIMVMVYIPQLGEKNAIIKVLYNMSLTTNVVKKMIRIN